MIPLTLAEDIRETLLDYLATTFNLQDAELEAALLAFLRQDQGGLFKGPYVHLRLPFRKAGSEVRIPLEIKPSFTPYVHQLRAFERLTSQGGNVPLPTLITTGTGSGKTECFLYPILDACYLQRGQPGIKAIILYPMNALASDQAGRLAKIIYDDPRLRGQVRAGIYIGGEGEGHTAMGVDHLIEDRHSLRREPPDILLTNYKMLDFLLLRPEDKALWRQNGPDTLRYLVLDELHTYDGAQGSDVACLIRRLKARLGMEDRHLCPVGTSATVVSEQGDTVTALTNFASQIFAAGFGPESVIGEERVSLASFLPAAATLFDFPGDRAGLQEQAGESREDYVQRQSVLWFGRAFDPLALAEALRTHAFLRALLAVAGDSVTPWHELLAGLARWDLDFAAYDHDMRAQIVQSFLALVAQARAVEGFEARSNLSPGSDELPPEGDAPSMPFLTLQVQLWVREMSRLMRQVSAAPAFFWRDDVPIGAPPRGLPAYFCRECGHSGWLAMMHAADHHLTDDPRAIYQAYFDRSRNIRYVYPGVRENQLSETGTRLCPQCLAIGYGDKCSYCHGETIVAVIYVETTNPKEVKNPRDLQRCPVCGSDDALSIMGSQAASLSSVAISHLYTSPLNTDKKLLAFTDSVQDASHRAAFFGARTYRFSLRTAFQAVLRPGQPVRLSEFTGRLLDHWRSTWSGAAADQRLAATFMPPDLHEWHSYSEFMEASPGPMPSTLHSDLARRLSWEVTMEYGFNARIGRSLEKVGSSTAFLDPELLDRATDALVLNLREEIGLLRAVPVERVHHFVSGLLARTRMRGGVVHELLVPYILNQGNWFQLSKVRQPLMSPFNRRSRLPKFLTDQPQRDVFDAIVSRGDRATWYTDWAQRTLEPALGVPDINEVYRQTLSALTGKGLLRHFDKSQSFGLSPEALLVTGEPTGVRCRECGHEHTVTPDTQHAWAGMACLSYQCRGVYVEDATYGQSYYKAIYQRGHVERIFPHEHTGLLDRKHRERVEREFKDQSRADAANLLTATPTLELGIDIGDLSATMACAVPPTTANYLQRIGRAGRKTGNSLILALANAQPHDLYFFEEPLEMIAGTIVPPGIFLDAPGMLERQWLAFCLSAWTTQEAVTRPLPKDVRQLLASANGGGFPESFLSYYAADKAELTVDFLALFANVISTGTREQLLALAGGEELPRRIRAALGTVETERVELQATYRSLKRTLEDVKADPAQYQEPEQELKQLEQEMRVVSDLLNELLGKYVLNFFTDAGLLPNYAFPETGVRLRAVVTGLERQSPGDKGYLVREYLRSAPAAIRELAPFNSFYAEGRKLAVTHLETPGREEAFEHWQFCDRCSHLALIKATAHSSACPSCGSTMWSDAGQRHDMVRLRQVAAWTSQLDSQVGDDSEERDRETYETDHFFDMQPEHSTGAHLIRDLPFGIEHLDQTTLREVNFGHALAKGQRVKVADEERPQQGFLVCKGCGVARPTHLDRDGDGRLPHLRNCRYRSSDGDWQEVYVYRELTSEALRILLPVSTVLISEKLVTFEACLDLGLRRKFGGNPDHLQILPHVEPAADGTRRRYLVIYDTVPGGTSFLRDLARPDEFRQVLQLALDVLTSCTCRSHPAKRACYRCLYSHRSRRDLQVISRELGIEMLQTILSHWDQLQPVASLSDAHMDSLVESELEQRFVEAMATYAAKTSGCSWTARILRGKLCWEFGLNGQSWLVEPQVLLGPADGVKLPSKPDFVLWPRFAPDQSVKPVTVFTDGFAFHVRPQDEVGQVSDDIAKRRALVASGRFVVWSVTWDDVADFGEGTAYLPEFLNGQTLNVIEKLARTVANPLGSGPVRQNAVAQLVDYLRLPEPILWQQLAAVAVLATMTPPRPSVTETTMLDLRASMLQQVYLASLDVPTDSPVGDRLYGIVEKYASPLRLLAFVLRSDVEPAKAARSVQVVLRLEDGSAQRSDRGFGGHWRRFWLLSNLFQFLPGFVPVSQEGIGITASAMPVVQPSPPWDAGEAWNEVFTYADSTCAELLGKCQAEVMSLPEVGYEMIGAAGAIVAQAELAWPELKVAVIVDDAADRSAFTNAGWNVFHATEVDQVLAALSAAALGLTDPMHE